MAARMNAAKVQGFRKGGLIDRRWKDLPISWVEVYTLLCHMKSQGVGVNNYIKAFLHSLSHIKHENKHGGSHCKVDAGETLTLICIWATLLCRLQSQELAGSMYIALPVLLQ